ncbi:hypothetical protein EDD17DRAFT_1753268 [Pisolithus thermaeus]|nr:hypothetical protein EDD17DRAFT_1753268 [Pisolithus thermaeus]
MTEEQCQEPEKCSESARPGSKTLQSSSSTSLEIQSLTHNLQDSSKPLEVPGEGLRSQVVEAEGIKVAAAELSSPPLIEGQCKSSFEHIEVTSYIAEESLTAVLQVKLEVTEAWGDSPVSQPEHFHSSLPPHTNIQPQIPPIKLRDAEDEQRVNKQPVEAVACAPELPKPTPEPRGDLCEVPEQARSIKVKEIKLEVKAKGQSKVVAWRKPPEAKIGRKSLKSVSWRIREFLPEFWTTHNSGMDLEPRSRDLHDESKHA